MAIFERPGKTKPEFGVEVTNTVSGKKTIIFGKDQATGDLCSLTDIIWERKK